MIKLLLFFQRFSIWLKVFFGELSNNLISLCLILALYSTLWYFPQTTDLLLILNQADAFLFEVPLYFFLLIVYAFIIWNVPKYFYFYNYKDITFLNLIGFIPNQHYKFQDSDKTVRYHYKVKVHMRMVLPRILALLLLIISALSILNAMKLFELDNIYVKALNPSNTLLYCVIFLLLLSEPILYNYIRGFFSKIPRLNMVLMIITIGLVVFIISLGTINTQAEKDLGNLFLSNCAVILFFFIVCFNSYNLLKRFSKRFFYGGILLTGFIVLASFLVLNFIPEWATKINPLSILILSLLSLFMISFVLILIGKKIKLPLLTITIILCLVSTRFFSGESDHYQLSLKDSKVIRPSIEDYIYHWVKDRSDLIEKTKKGFPVLLISSEGGGSRAGLWSFLVHSYLYERSNGKYFTENVLSFTGASGGSVGNAMFFAEAHRAALSNQKANFKVGSSKYPAIEYKASVIYKKNYLSVALLSLFGRDLFKDITGLFNFKNRGSLLEEQWNKAYKIHFSEKNKENMLEQEFLSFYEYVVNKKGMIISKNIPPLLLINTTHTQTGAYNIISPVRYTHQGSLAGMDDFIENLQEHYPEKSIDLLTAMRINAAFPYITPVGELKKTPISEKLYSDQYADAGYYDNIGGRVSKGIEEVLKKMIRDSFPNLQDKIQVKHLVISNSKDRKIKNTQTQFAAPLTTLQNVRYGHTKEISKKLENKEEIKLKPTTIPLSVSDLKNANEVVMIKPVLPLGRYLSTVAIRSIEARLQEVKPMLDSILSNK